MQTLLWRRTDDFSWGSAMPFSLPAGSWSAAMSLRDSRTPNAALNTFGIVVTLTDNGPDPANPGCDLFDILLFADKAAVAAWPKGRLAGELVNLAGCVSFSTGVLTRSSDEFCLQERP